QALAEEASAARRGALESRELEASAARQLEAHRELEASRSAALREEVAAGRAAGELAASELRARDALCAQRLQELERHEAAAHRQAEESRKLQARESALVAELADTQRRLLETRESRCREDAEANSELAAQTAQHVQALERLTAQWQARSKSCDADGNTLELRRQLLAEERRSQALRGELRAAEEETTAPQREVQEAGASRQQKVQALEAEEVEQVKELRAELTAARAAEAAAELRAARAAEAAAAPAAGA
ncbi:unnamed protein product, partial [Prorocentrum cordatum]